MGKVMRPTDKYSLYEPTFKRNSNFTNFTDFINSGVNSLENSSQSKLSSYNNPKKSLKIQQKSHSNFIKNDSRNHTYFPDSIIGSSEKEIDNNKINKTNRINSGSMDEKNSKVKSKSLFRDNIIKEYENRIRYFLRKEKFFLSDTNNLKINIPFPYFLQSQNIKENSKFVKERGGKLMEYQSVTERKDYKSRSVPKNFKLSIFICIFLLSSFIIFLFYL